MLKLGELSVVFRGDDSPLKKTIQSAESKMRAAGAKAREYAPIVGAAMAAGIGAGLLSGLDLEAARAKLSAQVGDPALAEQLGKVAGQVYGRGFTASAEAAMDAVRSVMQAGLVPDGDSAALEDLTVKAQAYADAWRMDVSEAVSTASTLVKSGLAKDATNALDLLTVASRKVPDAMVGDLGEVSAEYAQFFARLGFSGEQAFALLAQGADKGAWGLDKTGDAVKEFAALATELEGAPVDAFKALGFNARQMQNDILAGGDSARSAFDKTVKALLSVKDPAKQAQLAMDLFGTPLEDLNKADIPEFLKSLSTVGAGLGDVSGAAAAAGDAFEGSAAQKLEKFKRQVQQALVDKLGQAIPYLEKVGRWAIDNSGTLLTLGATIAGIAVVVYSVRGAMAAWNAVMIIWTGITKVATAAQWLWNVAMMANPIGLIILAIIALVGGFILLWKNSESFRNFWIATWDVIWSAVKFVWDWIKDNWQLLLGIITGPIGAAVILIVKHWDKIKGGAVSAWNGVVNAAKSAWNWIKSVPGKLRDAFLKVGDFISKPFRAGFNAVARGWNNTVGRLSWTVPGWVPGIGGNNISAPRLPYLAKGGHILGAGMAVVGEAGPELVHLGRGATVQPLTGAATGGGHAEARELRVSGEFRIRGGDLVAVVREDVRGPGRGDVVSHLGPSTGRR